MGWLHRNKIHKEEAPQYTIESGVCSDVGRRRTNNEDNYWMIDVFNEDMEDHREEGIVVHPKRNEWFGYGVFDGMGGGADGEVAAHISSQLFEEYVRENPMKNKTDAEKTARFCFQEANRRIVEQQERSNGMLGTTGTVVLTNGNYFKVFHMGDSRAYLFRNGVLGQITHDQTLAEMKLAAGLYAREDKEEIRDRHKLVSYIGCEEESEAIVPDESIWVRVADGDRILLCSDGLYDMCTDLEISVILGAGLSTQETLSGLVERALENGGVDNVTSLLLTFHTDT